MPCSVDEETRPVSPAWSSSPHPGHVPLPPSEGLHEHWGPCCGLGGLRLCRDTEPGWGHAPGSPAPAQGSFPEGGAGEHSLAAGGPPIAVPAPLTS